MRSRRAVRPFHFPRLLSSLADALATRVPSQCAICRAWPSRLLCDPCIARFAAPVARCPACAIPVPPGVERCSDCVRHPPPLDACIAACAYAWPWPVHIGHFKFRGETGWAAVFAQLMRSAPWTEPALERCDVVLPMPLAKARLRERGFNQSLELARRLSPEKTDATLLLRLRDTPAQHGLARAQRLLNLQGAFAVEPLRAASLRGRRVVLVDDVMTSGASLFAAAQVLRAAGAAHLTGLVLARTEAPA
ncbi:MAG TPA: ComF family protein [Variovorax sp.]|nr:ComF family protein [Variovorax sp.]